MQPIGFYLGTLARELHRLMNENLRRKGLSSAQIRVLGFLDCREERGESCIQEDIREHCNLRPSSVTSLIQTLEARGYIVRESGRDARAKRVKLTQSGRDLAQECKRFIDRVDECLGKGFTPEEQLALQAFLQRATENLHQMEREQKE